MGVSGLSFTSDMSAAFGAIGAITGMTETVKTNRYTSSVLQYTHKVLSDEFDDFMDGISATNKSRYGHVYEWRMTGMPQGRLWRHKLQGNGANRSATWEWKASQGLIPTPAERKAAGDPNDPISAVSDKEIAILTEKGGNKRYKFYWKAPVIEYGMHVVIQPKQAKALWIPAPGRSPYPKDKTPRNFVFKQQVDARAGSAQSIGAFTAAWVDWWATAAPGVFKATVARTVQQNLGRLPIEDASKRARSKTVGLQTAANNVEAFNQGKAIASYFLEQQINGYVKLGRTDDTGDGEEFNG